MAGASAKTLGVPVRETRSVCPVCLKNLPAALMGDGSGRVFLEKTCPEHGPFRTEVWQGRMPFERWISGAEPLEAGGDEACPGSCGLCPEHETGSCCVLLEVTDRCNLRCRYCFAKGGEKSSEPSAEELKSAVRDIAEKCSRPLLQLSGGEPTLRDDLPELVRFAKEEAKCAYVQVNTNGLRLAREPEYAAKLAEAGLDIVFLQFDGTKNEIYETLRGAPLLEEKLAAIQVCGGLKLGVTLVPTVVPGVNDGDLGDLVRLAVKLAPAVRGVHFQPVSYFGRYPRGPAGEERYTLDRLMADLVEQAGIPADSFLPSRCDHPLCGFHASFLIEKEGLLPLSRFTVAPCRSSAEENRTYIARRWRRDPGETTETPAGELSDTMDFDTFLRRMRTGSLTLTAMAFQDAGNLNVERLRRCSLHVYDRGRIVPFCARYLTAAQPGSLRETVFRYVKETFGVEPDYPFSKDPELPVLRHKDTRRWFGIVQTVARRKLGLEGEETVEVVNLKCSPQLSGVLRTRPGILPAWHMNREQWISVLLDGTVPPEELCPLIDLSFSLTDKKKKLPKAPPSAD